jgi:aminoglycoside 2'-N-acetyltransferase I
MMVTLSITPTKALTSSLARDIRHLLDAAFNGDFTDHDWEHALGGTHVFLTDSGRLICHGSLVERSLVCSNTTLTVGFVEAVATVASHRRLGHGARVMHRIEHLISEAYPLGVLSTGTHAFYASLGWERWRGPTFVAGRGVMSGSVEPRAESQRVPDAHSITALSVLLSFEDPLLASKLN